MLYGKILRPPSFGATLISYDDSAAKALKDVVLVRDGDFVGAAAPTVAAAETALVSLRMQWKEAPQISDQEIFSYLKKNAEPSKEARFQQAKGPVQNAISAATHKLDATYTGAYIAHAALEPRADVAQ